ncbi:hypothetical protein [Brevibacillus gelatini]|uniref:hypothetical protein n=1 Tax=Brevibacillus gelatini TaxID=1655277 RepID=UPI0011CEC9FD|nr:hypothetical protein [Brevibacillus gelatini]
MMRRNALATAVMLLGVLTFTTPGHATVANYDDTDLLNAWRVSNNGYIYTPIALTTKVVSDFSLDYTSKTKTAKRWDLSASISSGIAGIFEGSLSVGTLNIRGSSVSLPNISSYVTDPNTVIRGRNWTGSKGYTGSEGDCYGTSSYIVSGSKGYQTNSTGEVNFRW